MATSVLAAGTFCAASPAFAAGTPAGTIINNSATATYDLPGGGQDSVTSNIVSLTVDELLDVSVASTDGGDVATVPGAVNQVLTFRVTNAGNGGEAFGLTARDKVGGDDFDPSATSIVLDSNGNGIYDPGIDTVYVAGANDPVLAPDASALVFVLSSIPAGAADSQRGRVDLVAVAATGSGAPGTTFAGQGQGGGDAVVGATGADAEDDGYYRGLGRQRRLREERRPLLDPFGGDSQRAGLDHHLPARRHGQRLGQPRQSAHRRRDSRRLELSGPARSRSRARPLSDAADADAGEYTGTGIAVRLGTVAARRDPHRHVPSRDRLKEFEMKRFLILLALLLPSVALAQSQVALTSEMLRRTHGPPTQTARRDVRSRRPAWSRPATVSSSCSATATTAPLRRPTSW